MAVHGFVESDALSNFFSSLSFALHAYTAFALTFYLGQAGAIELGFDRRRSLRWLAAMVVGGSVLSALFHLTATLGLYTAPIPVSLLAVSSLLVAAARLRGQRTSLFALLVGDFRCVTRLVRVARTGPLAVVYLFLMLAALLVASRVLQSPPLAWDALTYHAVKPVLWIQSGGDLLFDAPGGWSTHKGRLAGAEIFGAWAILVGHGDALWGAVDLLWWFGLALGLHQLAAQLGLRARDRAAVTAYGCFIPAVLLSVGSGYVELPLSMLFVTALTFLIVGRSSSRGGELQVGAVVTSGLAIALLIGMKLMAWLAALLLLAVCLLSATAHLRRGSARRKAWAAVGIVCLAVSTVALPGPVRQLVETGYPFSVPLVVGSWTLGPDNPEVAYLETLSASEPTGAAAELRALAWIFGSPFRHEPQLTVLAACILALSLAGAVRGLARRQPAPSTRRFAILLLLLSTLALLATYFAPAFETVRLHWARSNARHLLPALLPLLPLALLDSRARSWRSGIARSLLLVAACWHAVTLVAFGWSPGFGARALTGLVVLLASLAALAAVVPLEVDSGGVTRRRRIRMALALSIPLGILLFSILMSGPTRRAAALRGATVFEATPKYWAAAAQQLDDPVRPVRIAVTSGPVQEADGWFMYPFFGRSLANHIEYVPVTSGDEIIALAPGAGRYRNANVETWLARLRTSEIDYVMAFWPTRLELDWMQVRPDRFELVEGDRESWGLYRIKRD